MAELSNNPFIDHTASALSRFPNINAVSSSPSAPSAQQYSTPWHQQQQQQQQPSPGYIGASPTGYTQQQQQQYYQQSQWPQQQQQQQPQQQHQHQQYQPQVQAPYPSTNFQSPGTFGQQQQFASQGQVNPLATGYPQSQSQLQGQYSDYPTQQQATASYGYQQQSQPQQTGYGAGYPAQQPQHQQQQLLAQFDPYVNMGQLSSPGPGQGQGQGASIANGSGAVGSPPPGVQHPRMFIQTHKVELEAWDPPTWKQVQNVFEALKIAWDARKRAAETQVRALGGTVGASGSATAGFFGGGSTAAGYGAYGAYGGGYQTPQAQEIDRLNSVLAYFAVISPCLIPFLFS